MMSILKRVHLASKGITLVACLWCVYFGFSYYKTGDVNHLLVGGSSILAFIIIIVARSIFVGNKMFLKSKKDNKLEAVLEADFYHDGRGPELQNVVWGLKGSSLLGFEYFNPDDEYTKINLKHLSLTGVEAYSMSSEELHGDIKAISGSKAAIFEVKNSRWVASLNQTHVSGCKHFQIMFYDEIFDVICTEIKFGAGELENALNNAVNSLDKKEMLSGHFKPIDNPTWTDLGDNSN